MIPNDPPRSPTGSVPRTDVEGGGPTRGVEGEARVMHREGAAETTTLERPLATLSGVRSDTGPCGTSLLAGLAVGLLAYVVWRGSAWVTDDAWFCFRVVEQTVAGRFLQWNPHERVQVFSNPLWVLLLVPARLLVGSAPEAARLASMVFFVTACAVVAERTARTSAAAAIGWMLILLSSRTIVDWSASGLETPLSYFIIALFFTRGARTSISSAALAIGILGVHRLDASIIGVPLLTIEIVANRHGYTTKQKLVAIVIGIGPLLAWLAFATTWFGTPLPNPWFAKFANDIPFDHKIANGISYVLATVRADPIAAAIVMAAPILACMNYKVDRIALARVVGAYLIIATTICLGGDYMLGRFIAPALFLSSIDIARSLGRIQGPFNYAAITSLSVAPLALSLLVPGSWLERSIYSTRGPRSPTVDGIYDQPGIDRLPMHATKWEGATYITNNVDGVLITDAAGENGFRAGLETKVVDVFAIGDPLLARLPASSGAPGHHTRAIPLGRIEALRGTGTLADPYLAKYEIRLREITSGRLLTISRFQSIAYLLFQEPLAPTPDRRSSHRWRDIILDDGVPLGWCVSVLPPMLGHDKRMGHPVAQPDVLHAGQKCPVLIQQLPPGVRMELSLATGPWKWIALSGTHRLAEGQLDVEGPSGTLGLVEIPQPPDMTALWLSAERADAAVGHLRAVPAGR